MTANQAYRPLLLAVLCLTLVVPVAARGHTRTAALSTASGYLLVTFDVTSANVYPAISCYDPSEPDLLPDAGALVVAIPPGWLRSPVFV